MTVRSAVPQVGALVDVWWDDRSEFFRGRLSRLVGRRPSSKRFHISYDDGDELVHDLSEFTWRFSPLLERTPGATERPADGLGHGRFRWRQPWDAHNDDDDDDADQSYQQAMPFNHSLSSAPRKLDNNSEFLLCSDIDDDDDEDDEDLVMETRIQPKRRRKTRMKTRRATRRRNVKNACASSTMLPSLSHLPRPPPLQLPVSDGRVCHARRVERVFLLGETIEADVEEGLTRRHRQRHSSSSSRALHDADECDQDGLRTYDAFPKLPVTPVTPVAQSLSNAHGRAEVAVAVAVAVADAAVAKAFALGEMQGQVVADEADVTDEGRRKDTCLPHRKRRSWALRREECE